MKYKAECTWGDGPDVLLVIESIGRKTYYFDLTSKEAKELANQLLMASSVAKEMDESLIEYFDTHEQ